MTDPALVHRIAALERRLNDLARHERGWSPTFLTTPYTNADFDGDSFSDVAANTKIENTSWSTTIPSDAKALLIRLGIRDSDSANTAGLYFELFGAAAAGIGSLRLYLSGVPNNQFMAETAVVPCTDGDIWYRCNASGADTMDVYLRCFGYWR